VDTGIGLKNRHMRGYLDTAHFPNAELHVAGKAVVLPGPGKTMDSDVPGILTLPGVSRPCSIDYRGGAGRTG